jgi:hypothetical protein
MLGPIHLLFGRHPLPWDQSEQDFENNAWLVLLREQLASLRADRPIAIWLEQGLYDGLPYKYSSIFKWSEGLAAQHQIAHDTLLDAIAEHRSDCPLLQLAEPMFREFEKREKQRPALNSVSSLVDGLGMTKALYELATREKQTRDVRIDYEHPPLAAWTSWISSQVLEFSSRTAACAGHANDALFDFRKMLLRMNSHCLLRDSSLAAQLSSAWANRSEVTHFVLRGANHEQWLVPELKARGVEFVALGSTVGTEIDPVWVYRKVGCPQTAELAIHAFLAHSVRAGAATVDSELLHKVAMLSPDALREWFQTIANRPSSPDDPFKRVASLSWLSARHGR